MKMINQPSILIVSAAITIYLSTLILLSSKAYAADLEKYAEALDWQEKWQKIITRSTDNYIDRHLDGKINQFSKAKQEQIAKQLKEEMVQRYNWSKVRTEFSEVFVNECGTDLMDKLVDFYSGAKFSDNEKQKISNAYKLCGKKAIEESVKKIIYRPKSLSKRSEAGLYQETNLSSNRAIAKAIVINKKAFKSFIEKYIDASEQKAFAQSSSGKWVWRSNRTSRDHAINNVLTICRARNKEFEKTKPCRIININDEWTDMDPQSIPNTKNNESLLSTNKALRSYQEEYLDERNDKAFAQSDSGTWSWRSSKISKDDAIKKTLTACRGKNKKQEEISACRIVNVNNNWLGD